MSEITYISHNNHTYIQLEKEISRLSAAVAVKNQSLSFIHEKLKIRDTRIKELQTKIADEVAVSKRLRGEINTASQSETVWRHNAAVNRGTIDKLNREITDLFRDLSASGITIRELQISLSRKKKGFKDNIKKLNDSCKEEIEFLKVNCASHSDRVRYLEEANSKRVIKNRRLRDEINRLKQDLLIDNRIREKTAEPKTRQSCVCATMDRLFEKVKSLESQLAHVLKTVSVLHNMTESLKSERDRFQVEWKASEKLRIALQVELVEYMKQVGNRSIEGFDPIPCHGIDFWIKTKEKNGEISDENERS